MRKNEKIGPVKVQRKHTREVTLGSLKVGGRAPISVQSMTNTVTSDINSTLRQAKRLESAGCEVVRVSIPDEMSVETIKVLVSSLRVPVVADIHFHYRLAIDAVKAGAHGIRINPGNIGGKKKLKEVVLAVMDAGACLRIGVNSGSVEKRYRNLGIVEGMLASVESSLELITSLGLTNVKISAKASGVMDTIEVYRKLSEKVDYPLHLGVTEAGTRFSGGIRSAVALGILLSEGIGDTLRVSLAADPVLEVIAGFEILRSLGLREPGPTVIACPTCARAEFDVVKMAEEVEEMISGFRVPVKIAVMGCVVNGPGEALHADLGFVGSSGKVVVYEKGFKKSVINFDDWQRYLRTFLDQLQE